MHGFKSFADPVTIEFDRGITSVSYTHLDVYKRQGLDFHGVLFIGLMIGDDGPKVIEFNNRFGDPETQSVLMRLETDLADIFDACIDGTLDKIEIKWSDRRAVCVVLASGGYPGSYEKGKVISGLDDVDDDIVVFHAGTALKDGQIVTSGGRVLGVTAVGATNDEARAKAFANVEKITFEGAQFRLSLIHIWKISAFSGCGHGRKAASDRGLYGYGDTHVIRL